MINPLLQLFLSGVLQAFGEIPFAVLVYLTLHYWRTQQRIVTWWMLLGAMLSALSALVPCMAWYTLYDVAYPAWLPGVTLAALALTLLFYIIILFQGKINDWPRWPGGNGGLLP